MNWRHAGLVAFITAPLALPQVARAQIFVGIAVPIAPPPLLVYAQPPIPAPNYIWTPGYWGWDQPAADYYWIPGAWILAPQPGYLWTPGYWGWNGGRYFFHAGYWGPQVGFYGGVPYGYGYTGVGYQGGYWQGPHFFYNRAFDNFGGRHFGYAYDRPFAGPRNYGHISYNGGPGGIGVRPTADEMSYDHAAHVGATPMQMQHFQAAQNNRAGFYNANHDHPAVGGAGHNPYSGPHGVPMGHGPVVTHESGERGIERGGARPGGEAYHSGGGQRPGGDYRPAARPGGEFHGGGGGGRSAPHEAPHGGGGDRGGGDHGGGGDRH